MGRDQVVRADLALGSGRLEPAPRTITVELRHGTQAHRRLTLVNSGDAAVRYAVEEVPGRPHGTPVSDTGTWESITPYPSYVSNAVAGVHDGSVYAFGGLALEAQARADGYRYDEDAEEWVRLADMPEPHRTPAGGFVDGRFVVTGGWDPDEKLTAATAVYDPGTDTWTEGADNPRPWGAAASAVLEGRLYVVGGCAALDSCGRTDVMVYDPAADAWEQVADYPQPVGWASCGGIAGKVYCAGGYGPGGDRLAAFAYDPDDDEWTRLPDGPVPLYKSAGVCGMTMVGGADHRAWGIRNAERLPYGGDCEPAHDRAWVRVQSPSGRIPADRSRSLNLTFDARRVPVGVHEAYLRLGEDTPYGTKPVRVRLVVRR